GAAGRDRGVRVERPRTLRGQLDVLRAQQRLDLDVRRGLVPDPGILDLEVDPDVLAVQADLGHLADVDPGDGHVVTGDQAGVLGEVRRVGGAAADDRQVVGVEGGQHQQHDHGQADHADDVRVA